MSACDCGPVPYGSGINSHGGTPLGLNCAGQGPIALGLRAFSWPVLRGTNFHFDQRRELGRHEDVLQG